MEVQVVTQTSLERWAVQEREEEVDTREIQVDEMVNHVWLWEIVAWWVEAEGSAFPLSTLYERGEGHAISKAEGTHCVLSPELGSALGHVQLHNVLFGAAVFRFEIKGGLHEIRAA